MPVQPIYNTGTATVAGNSAAVVGQGTAWALALTNGGSLSFKGRSIPIASVEDDTHLTLAYAAPADMAGSAQPYAIELGRADIADTIRANRLLADLVLSLSALNVSPFAKTLLDDADAVAALATLGVSAFARTLLDDASAGAALATLGAQADLGFTPLRSGGGPNQSSTAISIGRDSAVANFLRAAVGTTDLGRVWADAEAARSLGVNGYQKLPGGLILQWGRSGNGDVGVILPVAFPNNFFSVVASPIQSDATAGNLYACHPSIVSLTQFNVRPRVVQNGGAVGTVAIQCFWMAIGN